MRLLSLWSDKDTHLWLEVSDLRLGGAACRGFTQLGKVGRLPLQHTDRYTSR